MSDIGDQIEAGVSHYHGPKPELRTKEEQRVDQIRRAHASARPTHENPAWMHTHNDCSVLLAYIDALLQRIELLKMPPNKVIELAGDWDGVDSQALLNALLRKNEGQRKHIATLEQKLKEAQQLAMRQANELRKRA